MGQWAYIPRTLSISTDLLIPFKRLQCPVKISFALTVNKFQGQTFSLVRINLRKLYFSHGQSYIGLYLKLKLMKGNTFLPVNSRQGYIKLLKQI